MVQKLGQDTERFRLQFQTKFSNISTYANFVLPNSNVDLLQAGIITLITTPARQVQFALKLLF